MTPDSPEPKEELHTNVFADFGGGHVVEVPHEVHKEGRAAIEHWHAQEAGLHERQKAAAGPPAAAEAPKADEE